MRGNDNRSRALDRDAGARDDHTVAAMLVRALAWAATVLVALLVLPLLLYISLSPPIALMSLAVASAATGAAVVCAAKRDPRPLATLVRITSTLILAACIVRWIDVAAPRAEVAVVLALAGVALALPAPGLMRLAGTGYTGLAYLTLILVQWTLFVVWWLNPDSPIGALIALLAPFALVVSTADTASDEHRVAGG